MKSTLIYTVRVASWSTFLPAVKDFCEGLNNTFKFEMNILFDIIISKIHIILCFFKRFGSLDFNSGVNGNVRKTQVRNNPTQPPLESNSSNKV